MTAWNDPKLKGILGKVMGSVRSRGLALLRAEWADLSRVCENSPCPVTIPKRASNTSLDTKTGGTEPVVLKYGGEMQLNRITLHLRPTKRKVAQTILKSAFNGVVVPRRAAKQIR